MVLEDIFSSFLISDGHSLGLLDMTLGMGVPFLLMFPVVTMYKWVQKNNNFSSSFILTIFMFGILSAAVTMLIGNNIARAFGLVGALSIIRFRTAMKDPLDAVFIFWALAVGMACGTGQHLLSAAIVVLASVMLASLKILGISKVRYLDSVLKVVTRKGSHVSPQIESALKKKPLNYQKLNEYFNSDDEKRTYVYTLRRSKRKPLDSLEDSLKAIDGVESVTHLNHESSLFVENRH